MMSHDVIDDMINIDDVIDGMINIDDVMNMSLMMSLMYAYRYQNIRSS